MAFTNPDDETLRGLLQATRRIAVIGLSPKPDRPSYQVAAAMQRYGYTVVPVRPATTEVLGEACHADLADVPGTVDMADVFRAAEHVGPIVDACIARGVKLLWLQEGVVNEAAAERARAAGVTVVMDRCLWKEYCRLGLDGE
jgi:predicted CoA-binding protein